MTKRLTPDELSFIHDNVGKLTDAKIAEILGCGSTTVTEYRHRLNIPKCKRARLSNEDNAFILAHYRVDMSTSELAAHFGIKVRTLYGRVRLLGIANDKSRNKRS